MTALRTPWEDQKQPSFLSPWKTTVVFPFAFPATPRLRAQGKQTGAKDFRPRQGPAFPGLRVAATNDPLFMTVPAFLTRNATLRWETGRGYGTPLEYITSALTTQPCAGKAPHFCAPFGHVGTRQHLPHVELSSRPFPAWAQVWIPNPRQVRSGKVSLDMRSQPKRCVLQL